MLRPRRRQGLGICKAWPGAKRKKKSTKLAFENSGFFVLQSLYLGTYRKISNYNNHFAYKLEGKEQLYIYYYSSPVKCSWISKIQYTHINFASFNQSQVWHWVFFPSFQKLAILPQEIVFAFANLKILRTFCNTTAPYELPLTFLSKNRPTTLTCGWWALSWGSSSPGSDPPTALRACTRRATQGAPSGCTPLGEKTLINV